MADTEKKSGGGVPKGLPISGVILLVLGLIAWQVIPTLVTEEQMARNVIVAAIPFILVFASIIIFFMSLIWYASSKLGGNISEKTYRPIEYVLIGGILLGIFLMFQPWVFELFRVGFFMLLASTLVYILWSHVKPKEADQEEELITASVGESESGSGD
jgi:predicted neutral ceramidase superfamily lipid hydrolase